MNDYKCVLACIQSFQKAAILQELCMWGLLKLVVLIIEIQASFFKKKKIFFFTYLFGRAGS